LSSFTNFYERDLNLKIVKKIICLVALLAIVPLHGQWVLQNSGTSELLSDVYCITEDLAFVVGENGTILKTIDGGENWVQKTSGSNLNLIKVQFVDNLIGFAFGYNPAIGVGTIFKTVNGGESWNSIVSSITYYQNYPFSYGFYCINENIFYFSDNGLIKKTIDGGATITTVSSGYQEVEFITDQIGFSFNSNNNLIKSLDSGITWVALNNDYTRSFSFLNENNGFLMTSNGLYNTQNGGVDFNFLGSPASGTNLLLATSGNVVWGIPIDCLLDGSPCFSIRGEIVGANDFQITTGPPFKAIHFANPTKGFAILGSLIYKNTTGTMLGINEIDLTKKISIYPNPATEQINIAVNEKSIEPFTIEITDFLGKKVYSQYYHQAIEVLNIDTKTFSKGMYLLTINSQNKRETQKVIVN
jgi:Secretion system C-terminal sorting domain